MNKIKWTKIPNIDNRWEYKDTIERLGFWRGTIEYLSRIFGYWWGRLFYSFYEGYDKKFTYYKQLPKWVKFKTTAK